MDCSSRMQTSCPEIVAIKFGACQILKITFCLVVCKRCCLLLTYIPVIEVELIKVATTCNIMFNLGVSSGS